MKIMIGIPTQLMGRDADFYDWLDLIEPPENCEVFWKNKSHSQSPAKNRNLLIQMALEADCSHVFFIDDDCFIPPDTLKKLLAHDVDVVTGLYVMRNYPHQPIIFDVALDDGRCVWHNLTPEDKEQKLIPVVAAGAGCLLVKTSVFRKIREKYDHWFTLGELEPDNWCDDLSFFKRVRACNIPIYCDTHAPVGHSTRTIVWPTYKEGWKIEYDTLGSGRVGFPMANRYSIPSLKAPNDPRPTWRNGIIQVHVTRACDLACTGCTQGSNLAGKPTTITPEQFEEAVISLKGYQGVVGMFGGNPCVHPKFEQLCRIFEQHIPFEQRGLWSNNLRGHGKLCREIFNPAVSNLNVHTDLHAYNEIASDWPEANILGIGDSRHSPPYVAIKDMEDLNEVQMHNLISNCDINKYWSAMVCVVRGRVKGFFCELAGAQSMLHENDPDYPDTGVETSNQWWAKPITHFGEQVKKHCYECGIPLRGFGDLATGVNEYVSKTHLNIYKTKVPNRVIHLVTKASELGGHLNLATDYIGNGQIKELERVEANQ